MQVGRTVVGKAGELSEAAVPVRHWLIRGLQRGLLMGGVSLFVALAGLFQVFAERDIIGGVLSMSTLLLFLLAFIPGFVATAKESDERRARLPVHLASGALAGAIVGVFLALLALLVRQVNVRDILVNATPELVELLTFGLPLGLGAVVLVVGGGVLGALAAVTHYLGPRAWRAMGAGVLLVLLAGILQEIFRALLDNLGLGFLERFLFAANGLSIPGALLLLIGGVAWVYLSPAVRRQWRGQIVRTTRQQRIARFSLWGLGLALLLALPYLVGLYWADVLDLVGIYILMGLGLNIVVGYAGLLDLGYVAFFALGAYTTGYLTSNFAQEFVVRPVVGWSFWAAWPVAVAVAALAGVLLGIPVLRMRGDYLAIVTLGFGEIIRVLATSDLLKPQIGGAQGILKIPKPSLFGFTLDTSQTLYYLIFLGVLLAIYVSIRLAPSRIGRAWMAMREDEDVAEAMGINLVAYKLMAFATGAAFAGMAGAIFASKLASIFPHSFNLLWSINVLCLIIVGGMGSIPGVVVGAFILVGLPEVLREFAEYRMLFYGGLLVVMMLAKPEGFWPARRAFRPIEGDSTGSSEE